jgi:hypothetical protein
MKKSLVAFRELSISTERLNYTLVAFPSIYNTAAKYVQRQGCGGNNCENSVEDRRGLYPHCIRNFPVATCCSTFRKYAPRSGKCVKAFPQPRGGPPLKDYACFT